MRIAREIGGFRMILGRFGCNLSGKGGEMRTISIEVDDGWG